ncbi:hypothetical protein WICMUC_002109 [Wickerhamomyces mucosus]|uniref:CRIB domain-containing protein n=1 Tax=Wickerhamomyces mucosus TaxID=1378264 RepID=A0A9P8PQ91_9ASCO|nr:hypothetical protein WICMUC_002109 [Wickerhamomyces mucosus]
MDSIWIEENKLYQDNIPSVRLINSNSPQILNQNTIELPPLPPTSYFQTLLKEQAINNHHNNNNSTNNGTIGNIQENDLNKKFTKFFKKLSIKNQNNDNNNNKNKNNDRGKERPFVTRKISTPFGFNHISHVDHQPLDQQGLQIPKERQSLRNDERKLQTNSYRQSQRTSLSSVASPPPLPPLPSLSPSLSPSSSSSDIPPRSKQRRNTTDSFTFDSTAFSANCTSPTTFPRSISASTLQSNSTKSSSIFSMSRSDSNQSLKKSKQFYNISPSLAEINQDLQNNFQKNYDYLDEEDELDYEYNQNNSGKIGKESNIGDIIKSIDGFNEKYYSNPLNIDNNDDDDDDEFLYNNRI